MAPPGHRAVSTLSLFVVSILIASCSSPAGRPDPDATRFAERIAAFEQSDREDPPPADAILFVGSSSIRLWPTDSLFAGLLVINRGFGGSHISDVNYYVDRVVVPYAPATIVFYAGDNDVNDRKSPERVLRDYRTFVEAVRAERPDTRIIFLSIKPSASRWDAWPRMQEANSLIRSYSDSDSLLTFVDVATPLLGADGRPNGEYFLDDSLHLNQHGYDLWTGILHPVLEKDAF